MKFSKALLLVATCTGSAFAVETADDNDGDNMLDAIMDKLKDSMTGVLAGQGDLLEKLCAVPAKANTCMELLNTAELSECEAVQGLFEFENFEDMELDNLFTDLDIGGICGQDGGRRLLSVEPIQVLHKLKAVRNALQVTLQYVPKGHRRLMGESAQEMTESLDYLCASDGSGTECIKDFLDNQQEFFNCIGPVLEELVPNFQELMDAFAGLFEGGGLDLGDLLRDLLGGGDDDDAGNGFDLGDLLGGGLEGNGVDLDKLFPGGGDDDDAGNGFDLGNLFPGGGGEGGGFDLSDLLPGGGDDDDAGNGFDLGDLLGGGEGGGLDLSDLLGGNGAESGFDLSDLLGGSGIDIEDLFGFGLGSVEMEDVLGSLLEGFQGMNGSMDVLREKVLASVPNMCATNFGGDRCLSAGENLFDASVDQDMMCEALRKAGCCFGNIVALRENQLAVEKSLCDSLEAGSAACKAQAAAEFPPMEFPGCNVNDWACPVEEEEMSFGFVEIAIEDCDFSLLAGLDASVQADFSAAFAQDIGLKVDVAFEVAGFAEAAGGCQITLVVPDGAEEDVKDKVNEDPSFAELGTAFEAAGVSSEEDVSGAAEARSEAVTGGVEEKEEKEEPDEEASGAGTVLPGFFALIVSVFCALE